VAARSEEEFHSDFKSRLQEYVQTEVHETPLYEQVEMSGPAHDRQFVVAVRIRGLLVAEGQGKSKKLAEQDAAKNALEKYAALKQEQIKNNPKGEQK
jgi:ribonuclease-3